MSKKTDNITDFYGAEIAEKGYFATEQEFREFVSDENNARDFYNSEFKDKGYFGSDTEFIDFVKKKGETLPQYSSQPAAQGIQPTVPSGGGVDNTAKSAKIKELQTKYTTLVAQGQKDGWTPAQMDEYTKDVKSELESFMPKRDVGTLRLPTDKEKTSFAFRQQVKENDRQAGLNVPEYDLKGNETELDAMFRNNDYKEAKAQSDKLANVDRHTDSEQYAILSSKFDQTLKDYQSGKATKEDLQSVQDEFDKATNGAVVDYITTNSNEPQKELVKYANILDRKNKGEKVLDNELKFVLDMQRNAASQLANEAFTQMYEAEQSGDTDIYFEGINRINAKIDGLNKAGGVSEEAAKNIQKEIDDLSNQTNVSQETIAKLTESAGKLKNISGAINSIEQLNNEASGNEQTDRNIESEKVEYANENPIKATALEFGKQIVGTMGKGLLSLGQLPAIYDKDSASYNSNDFISSAIEGAKSNPTFTPISNDAPSYVKLAGELGGAVGSIAMYATGGSSRLATSAIAFITSEADAYKEAKDLGMNDSDARLYSTFFSVATAASEGIIKDSEYLTKNAKASVLRAFRSGKTMKESIQLATKEIPKSLETYLETSGKEGLEEGVSSMVGTITQGLSNEALGKQYYEGFNEENLKHDILLGAAAGGFMHTIRGRKNLSPVQESVLLDMTENAESIQAEIAKTDPNVAKSMSDAIEASKQALDALKSHSEWSNLDKDEQAHALALTQQAAAIEEEQKKIGAVRLQDAAKDEEIKAIEEELNAMFSVKPLNENKESKTEDVKAVDNILPDKVGDVVAPIEVGASAELSIDVSKEGGKVEPDAVDTEANLNEASETPTAKESGKPIGDYDIAQQATNEVSQENPKASILLTPKGDDLSLSAVYVGKDNRGNGIGTKVLESVKKQADKLGKKVVLDATNELDEETDLVRLGKFYEKNGFEKVGENKYEYNPKEQPQEGSSTEKPNNLKAPESQSIPLQNEKESKDEGLQNRVKQDWDNRVSQIDTEKEYTDLNELKVGDVVLTKSGSLGFVKKINPKNVIYESTYNINGETTLTELKTSKEDIQVFKKPQANAENTPSNEQIDLSSVEGERKQTSRSKRIEQDKDFKDKLDDYTRTYESVNTKAIIPLVEKYFEGIKQRIEGGEDIGKVFSELMEYTSSLIKEDIDDTLTGDIKRTSLNKSAAAMFLAQKALEYSVNSTAKESSEHATKWNNYIGKIGGTGGLFAALQNAGVSLDPLLNRLATEDTGRKDFLAQVMDGTMTVGEAIKELADASKLSKEELGTILDIKPPKRAIHPTTNREKFKKERDDIMAKVRAKMNQANSFGPFNAIPEILELANSYLKEGVYTMGKVKEKVWNDFKELFPDGQEDLNKVLDDNEESIKNQININKAKKKTEEIAKLVQELGTMMSVGVPSIDVRATKEQKMRDIAAKLDLVNGDDTFNNLVDDFLGMSKEEKQQREDEKNVRAFIRLVTESEKVESEDNRTRNEKILDLAKKLDGKDGGDFQKIANGYIEQKAKEASDKKVDAEIVSKGNAFAKMIDDKKPSNETEKDKRTRDQKILGLAKELDNIHGGTTHVDLANGYLSIKAKEASDKSRKQEMESLSKMMSEQIPSNEKDKKTREEKMREKATKLDNELGGTQFTDTVNDYFSGKKFDEKNEKAKRDIKAKEIALARAMSQKRPDNESKDGRTKKEKMLEEAAQLDDWHGTDIYTKQVEAYFNILNDKVQDNYLAAQQLAKALEGNTSDPDTQKKKALKIIADTILANDPDYITARDNKERVSAKERLKTILADKSKVSEIISKALSIATAKVQADKNLSDSQKQAIINQMEDMVAEITELPVNKTQQRAAAGALNDEDLQAEVKRIAEQHYTDPSTEIKSYAQKLVEQLDIDPAYADALQKQIEAKIEVEVQKKLDAQKERTEALLKAIGAKDKNMKAVVAKAIAKGMISDSQFEEEMLKALGYRGLSSRDIANIKNLMARMQSLEAGEELYDELSKQLNDILTEADESTGALLGRWFQEQFFISALSNFMTTALQNSLIGAIISTIQQGGSTALYNPNRFARAVKHAAAMKKNKATPSWQTAAAKWQDVTRDFGETTQHDKQPTKAHSAVDRVTMKSYSDMLDDLKNAKHGRKLYYAVTIALKTGSHITGAGKRKRKFPAYSQISSAIMSTQDLLQGAFMEDLNSYIEAERYLDALNKGRKKEGRKEIPKGTKRWDDRMRLLTSTGPEAIARINKEVDEEARVRIANGEELPKGWKRRRTRAKMQETLPKSVLDEAIYQGKKALFLHKPESKPGALIYKLVSDALIINDKDGGIAIVKTMATMITGFFRLSIVAAEMSYRTIPIVPIVTKLASGQKQRFIDGKLVGVPLTEEDIKRRIVSNLATTVVWAALISSMFDWEDEEDEQGNKVSVIKLNPNSPIKFYGGGDDEKQRNMMKAEGAEPNSISIGSHNVPLTLLGFGLGVIGKVLGEVSNDVRFRKKSTDDVMSFDDMLGVTVAQVVGSEYSPVKKSLKEAYSRDASTFEAIEILALDGIETAISPSILEAVKKEYDAYKGLQKQKRDGLSDQIFGDIVFADYFIDKNGGKLYDHFGQPIYCEPSTPILKALLPASIWANGTSHVKNSPYYSLTDGEWFPKEYTSWTAADWNWEENGKPRTYSDEQKEDIAREMDVTTANLINSEYKSLEAKPKDERIERLKELRSMAITTVREKYSKAPKKSSDSINN